MTYEKGTLAGPPAKHRQKAPWLKMPPEGCYLEDPSQYLALNSTLEPKKTGPEQTADNVANDQSQQDEHRLAYSTSFANK